MSKKTTSRSSVIRRQTYTWHIVDFNTPWVGSTVIFGADGGDRVESATTNGPPFNLSNDIPKQYVQEIVDHVQALPISD